MDRFLLDEDILILSKLNLTRPSSKKVLQKKKKKQNTEKGQNINRVQIFISIANAQSPSQLLFDEKLFPIVQVNIIQFNTFIAFSLLSTDPKKKISSVLSPTIQHSAFGF